MKLPKPNELIRVFNDHYSDEKLRYFKEKSPDPKSPICVYANGQTKETNNGGIEYWDRWEYPEPLSDCKICKGTGKYSYHGHIVKCSCLTDPEKRNVKESVRQIDIPKNIEDYICDSDIPDIWYRANNKIYKNTDSCVNDLRRFALMCFYDFSKKN